MKTVWLVAAVLVFGASASSREDLPHKLPSSRDELPSKLVFDDGRFALAVFTDLHFGEREGDGSWAAWGEAQDRNSSRVMGTVLDLENLDLVVFNGDQVTGENLFASNATRYLDAALSPTVSRRIPFASVYGNHDNSQTISHSRLYDYEKEHYPDLSHTRACPTSAKDSNGMYNYYLPVYSDEASLTPALILWFFDSRSGTQPSSSDPIEDWVDPQVATWINSTASELKARYGVLPPALAFVHIPPSFATQAQSSVVRPDPLYPGINDDDPVDTQGQGDASTPDEPFWTALTATLGGANGDGLLATVVGHDHGNDWCARTKSNGIAQTLCFARHTGYGGYGHRARGSRIFEFTLTDSLAALTWIRMEDGTKVDVRVLQRWRWTWLFRMSNLWRFV